MKKQLSFSSIWLKIASAIALAGIVIACLGSYAWFYNRRIVYTFAHVAQPSTLAIKGPNETTIEQIDLSTVDLQDASQKASFVFCVAGSGINNYKLELAYTTNVPFTYTVRRTTQSTEKPAAGTETLTYTDGTNAIYYYAVNESDKLTGGTYINLNTADNTAIQDSTNTADRHQSAYGEYPRDNVQIYAEPVYCLYNDLAVQNHTANGFVDYYILELTWSSEVSTTYQKETDLVYLLAANAG